MFFWPNALHFSQHPTKHSFKHPINQGNRNHRRQQRNSRATTTSTGNTDTTMNNHSPFSFQNQLSPLPPSNMYNTPGSQSLKRKSSYDDISPLAMKTRTGIGLEEEIVYGNIIWLEGIQECDTTRRYLARANRFLDFARCLQLDRTITMMMEGQRKLLEEQRLRELETNMQRQAQLEHQQHLHHQHNKASASEALKRLFMVGKHNPTPQQYLQQQGHTGSGHTFADCAGEISGCETYRIPGMRDRQAFISACTFCQRPQCQFCAVRCTRCQELSCRACSVAR